MRLFSYFLRKQTNLFDTIRRYQSIDFIPTQSYKLNCDIIILTKDGQLTNHYGPFERAQICQQFNLEPRDLQKIDTDLLINVPVIDVRQNKFICFSYRRLRSLVEANRSIFFLPSADKVTSEPLGLNSTPIHWERIARDYHRNIEFIQRIYNERFVQNQSLHYLQSIPFEFCLTEINLEAIANGLRTKTNELVIQFKNVRERAYNRITLTSLRELALLKEKVDKYKRNADLAHQSIVDVLAQDEDMIGMYLTDNRKRDLSDHMQIELLLEASTKQMAEVRRSITDLSDSVHTLESATGFMLDAVRNELLAFEIRINVVTMGFGLGAFIAGIYGMNLTNGFEQNPYAFYAVAGTTLCFIGGAIAIAFVRLLRYRKVRLHRSNKIDIF